MRLHRPRRAHLSNTLEAHGAAWAQDPGPILVSPEPGGALLAPQSALARRTRHITPAWGASTRSASPEQRRWPLKAQGQTPGFAQVASAPRLPGSENRRRTKRSHGAGAAPEGPGRKRAHSLRLREVGPPEGEPWSGALKPASEKRSRGNESTTPLAKPPFGGGSKKASAIPVAHPLGMAPGLPLS